MTSQGKWYSILARASDDGAASDAEIHIYGDIGPSWWGDTTTAAQFVKDINALDAKRINVRINSVGGSVNDGVAIYNAIRRHAAEVTTTVDGAAYSIASLIAMAGDKREMASNATMMIHAPWVTAAGNASQLRETADTLDVFAKAMASSYAAATGMTSDDVLSTWLEDGKDHWFNAEEAKAAGLIDTIYEGLAVEASFAQRFRAQRQEPTQITEKPAAAAAIPAANAAEPTKENAMDQEAIAAQAKAEGAKAEAARREAIEAKFAPFAQNAAAQRLMKQCVADVTVDEAQAGLKLLEVLAKGVEPATPAGSVTTVEDEADKFRAAATNAILARAGAVDEKGARIKAEDANPLRGRRLLQLAEASLQRAGVKTDGMDQMAIVARAFTQSTSDFPILLENTMHKSMQAAYAMAPDTWTRFCARGSVSDFRPHKRYKVGGLSNLEALTELSEFKNKSIPDGAKEQISAATKGNLINISRHTIINDDLGVFGTLAAALGRAAKRTIEADVYALLASNPVMGDGNALFSAAHGNLAATGAAPSVVAFDAIRVAMAQQMDVNGVDYLDILPAIWLGPIGLGSTVRVLNSAQFDPDATNKVKPNVVNGLVRDIIDTPRLTGTAYYMFAEPGTVPTIEVVFLDGNDTPFLESQTGWTVDGTAWKIRLDFGVGAIDWKGAYKQPGA